MPPFKWEFYIYSGPAWESMLNECKKAQKTIDIEQYIFADDKIGKQFIEVLKSKAKQGVKVRLLIDMVGSSDFYRSSTCEDLRKAGIEIKFFNVVSFWRLHNFTSWFFRDHRKILLVDDRVSFTGGLGIRDNMKDWQDFTARLEGLVVDEMKDSFNQMWLVVNQHGFINRIRWYRKQRAKINFITNDPYFKKRFLYYSFLEAIRSAEKIIYITTPYFIPDRKFSRAIILAANRGVDVRLLIPEKMDVPVLATASNSVLEKFLKRGVKIYKYLPEFIHSKTALIDDDWGTFGSLNLDNLSFDYNHEANVVTNDKKCVEDLKNIFIKNLEKSVELKYEEWKKRPLIDKIREFFVSFVRRFL